MADAAIQRVRVRVTGLVQGVYYRASTRERARVLGLGGWVRNTDDGAVELEAEGSEAAVGQLVAWCREGPPGARVRDVHVEAIPPRGQGTGFEIRR